MNANFTSLNDLAQRVQEGDARAKSHMKEQLGPQLARIVRRVLERGTASSPLEHKILAAAHRLAPAAAGARLDARTDPVARSLCQMVVSRLWPGSTEGQLQATAVA